MGDQMCIKDVPVCISSVGFVNTPAPRVVLLNQESGDIHPIVGLIVLSQILHRILVRDTFHYIQVAETWNLPVLLHL